MYALSDELSSPVLFSLWVTATFCMGRLEIGMFFIATLVREDRTQSMSYSVRVASLFAGPGADTAYRTGLHNTAHPRTDSVVIMAVVNEANDQILLGRNVRLTIFRIFRFLSNPVCEQKKFPGMMYSTLAGFIEPGEAFEDAVKREILEEAGIHVTNVRYHSAQPWVRHFALSQS